jgi:hypothetical protein
MGSGFKWVERSYDPLDLRPHFTHLHSQRKEDKLMVVSCVGDAGDSCVLLGIMQQIHGGPHKLLLTSSPQTKMKTDQAVRQWCHFLKPLADAQPYIEECRILTPQDHVDWASGGFRGSGLHSRTASLFQAQLSHLVHTKGFGQTITPLLKWLHVEPSQESRGRIICARSGRYRNGSFPWKQIVQHYGDRLLFIGLKHEHAEFCSHWGMVEYRPVNDLLEMAQIIAGSELFIGNQSSPMAVAEGLKHRTIQETSTDPADCIYFRENAQWVDNGACILPDIRDSGTLEIKPQVYDMRDIVTHTTPPGQWQVEGLPPFGVFDDLMKVCELNGIGPKNGSLKEWIKVQNALRVPDFFFGEAIYMHTKNSEAARRGAGYPARTAKEMMGI